MALEKRWVCNNSDIVVHGEKLGYDSDKICDLMYMNGIYGKDSSGSTHIYHSKRRRWHCGSDVIQTIIDSLLDSENITDCEVINDS